jgi:hypothetical protein
MAGRGGEEEREAVRLVLVLPLLAGCGGDEERWRCASSVVALRRRFAFIFLLATRC